MKAAGAVAVAAGAVAGTARSWERGSWSLGESGPCQRVPCSRHGAGRHVCIFLEKPYFSGIFAHFFSEGSERTCALKTKETRA